MERNLRRNGDAVESTVKEKTNTWNKRNSTRWSRLQSWTKNKKKEKEERSETCLREEEDEARNLIEDVHSLDKDLDEIFNKLKRTG